MDNSPTATAARAAIADAQPTAQTAQTDFSGMSKEDTTREIAWQEFARHDKTPFERTIYDQLRPAHTATSLTELVARGVVDAAQAFEGMDGELGEWMDRVSPSEYRALKQAAFEAARQQMAGGKK
jgi:hypothetical protein